MDSAALEYARAGSTYRDVECQWVEALASAGGQFGKIEQAAWSLVPPYAQLADTCPLFMRKVDRKAVPNFVTLLWPVRLVTSLPLASVLSVLFC